MDARRLRTFQTVVREGSLSAAADELDMSQPAVSQQLKALEIEAGGPLLLRRGHSFQLTPAGTALLEHADIIIGELDHAQKRLDSINGLASGVVRVGAFPSFAATVLPEALRIIKKRKLELDVRLTEVEPDLSTDLLKRGELDLIVSFRYETAPDDEPELFSSHLLDDRLFVVLNKKHPLATKKSIDLALLSEEKWIAGCVRCQENLVFAASRAGFRPNIEQSTDDYVVTQKLVEAGLAISLLPELALKSVHLNVAAIPMKNGGARKVFVRGLPGADRVPSFARLIECLKLASASYV